MTKTLVDNPYALYTLLAKKYGNRFNADPFLAMRGRIDGTIDSKKISITFDGKEYLLISTSSTSRDVLEELQPLLTAVMGDEKPICSYDLQSEGLEESAAMPTIEWDIVAPEERLKEIINGRAFSDKSKIDSTDRILAARRGGKVGMKRRPFCCADRCFYGRCSESEPEKGQDCPRCFWEEASGMGLRP